MQLAPPQARDFSSVIQPLGFPVQPGAVEAALAEHEFDSIKKIYILRHLKKD